MARNFVINGRPPGARLELLEAATTIGRYARKVLIDTYGDQAPFLTQISDMVSGAVDKALRDLDAPLPQRAEALPGEGLRQYAMPARNAEEARSTPADNDGQPVPGGSVTAKEVDRAFTSHVPSGEIDPVTKRRVINPQGEGWLM